ncbi:hypothetical protein ACIBL3_30210 [Kribbella sp. NPDC050124]|uniref:hypothetical protein n=1 Tax=Kribbella sp. NPDC050124 TaxID=3364114 RepID=UPI0037B64B4F
MLIPIAGELVTETFDSDSGRQVTVYVPRDAPEAVVLAGDGQLISHWGRYLETADAPPTMIVGAYRADDEEEWVASVSTWNWVAAAYQITSRTIT